MRGKKGKEKERVRRGSQEPPRRRTSLSSPRVRPPADGLKRNKRGGELPSVRLISLAPIRDKKRKEEYVECADYPTS